MNISLYISKFNKYLTDLNRKNGKNYTVTNSVDSIMLYSDLFKNYLGNKLHINLNSIKTNDLLKMEYKDGKLINPEENKTSDTQNPFLELSSLGDDSIFTQNLNADSSQTQANEDDLTIIDFLNVFMENDTFKNAVDFDKDGELNQEEINEFLSGIKGLDNDTESLSLNDILTATKAIQDGTFNSDEVETKTSQADTSKIATDNTHQNSSASGTAGSGSYNGGNYNSSGVDEQPSDNNGKKNLSNLSEEELDNELTNANNALKTKQKELSAITNGTNSEVCRKQAEVDSLYQAYIDETNKVNPELAQVIRDITAKELETAELNNKLTSCEANVTTCENAKTNAENTYNNLVQKQSELKSKEKSPDITPEEKISISSKLQSIENELESAKNKKEQAEKDLKNAIAEKEQTIADKNTCETELAELQAKKTELEASVNDSPEIQQAKQAYETAKAELDTKKQQLIEAKNTEITEASNYVNEVQNAVTENKIKKDSRDFSPEPQYNSEFGNALADLAEKTANSIDTVGYCLRGVRVTIEDFLNQKTVLTGLGSAYKAANQFENDPVLSKYFTKVDVKKEDLPNLPRGAVVVWQRGGPTKGGQKHGHISIALGGGKEASDHTQNQVMRDCEFSVYYPTGDVGEFLKA